MGMFNKGDPMNEMLKTINTETLSGVISDVIELEAGLTEIFTKYDGMNIRSIVAGTTAKSK